MRGIAVVLIVALGLPMPGAAQARGDEAGTLKGVKGAPATPPGVAPKAKPGKGSGLMEEEGIYFRDKPTDKPKGK